MEEKKQKKIKLTESDLMWDAIRVMPINMYSLPNQRVEDHVERVKVTPNQLHLRLKSSSVIASLETTISGKFKLEDNPDGLVTISKLDKEENTQESKGQPVVIEVKESE